LLIFHVGVACNTNASDVCEIKFTYLLTYSCCGGCQSTRHPVNSSRSRLVTKRRSTRHKQTNKQTSKP